MKKIVIFSLAFFLQFWATAQMNTAIPDKMSKNDLALQYKEEGKHLNTAGFILLGVGLISYGVGSSIYNDDWNSTTGLVLGAAGLIMVPASIPCFIIAGSKNMRARILMQKEKAPLTFRGNNQSITSLSLAVSF